MRNREASANREEAEGMGRIVTAFAAALCALFLATSPAAAQQGQSATAGPSSPEMRELLREGGEGPLGRYEARGLVEPRAEAVLSSEISGRIVTLPFDAGNSFEKGDVLVGFDCAAYRAELAVAEAKLKAARKKLQNHRKRARLNAIGKLEVGLAEAAVEEAEASVRGKRLIVDRCQLTAPYDGKVVERPVNRHENVGQDQELMSVIAMGAPKIRLVVPSNWISWLSPGARFKLRIDETGAVHTGVVEAIGARIDPVSQTVQVFGRFAKDAPGLVPGMSGTARFRPDKQS